ncbi:MAG: hypothetical protein QOG91_372 [Candidatus Parcubacteria bacterium]|nr:hypothetical protein [Candidatus Parcubacteria bacterium]
MRLDGHLGRLRGAQVNKDKKIASQFAAAVWAKNIVPTITERDRLMTGIALYWAEGSKSPRTTGFVFVNSDPIMIKFMHDWLIGIVLIPKESIVAQVSINEIHRYRIETVLNFWSHLLDLPRNKFSNTSFIKSRQKKIHENHEIYYGVLRLSVSRSTFLKYKVLQMIEILKANVAQVVRAGVS